VRATRTQALFVYKAAVELLYGLSYAIKMGNKSVLEYVMPPLEGFWSVADDFKGGGAAISDKSKFVWTMMIRQPDFVNTEVFEAAKTALAKKKPELETAKARFETLTEGLCVQVMHIGSYDNEPAAVAAMERFAAENGYAIDINDTRRHHELPRRPAQGSAGEAENGDTASDKESHIKRRNCYAKSYNKKRTAYRRE
jgi:hypothetical protein